MRRPAARSVHVRAGVCARESRPSALTARALFLPPPSRAQSVTSPLRAVQQQRTLRLEVTDERDAFFLFFINVSEDEFPELKREQSLRVDFENFAQHFVELLTRVLDSAPASLAEPVEGGVIAAAAVGQSFHAVLRTASAADASSTDAFFEVVQANEFKNLMHLSLRMSAADDVATARNLAERLTLQRERNVEQRNELQQRTAALAVLQEEKSQAVEELEQAENKHCIKCLSACIQILVKAKPEMRPGRMTVGEKLIAKRHISARDE